MGPLNAPPVNGVDPRASRPGRVADLAGRLDAHRPVDDLEVRHLGRVRRALESLVDPFAQEAGPVHVTGSAIILPTDGTDRTVLHFHKRLHRWLQPGGHVDAGERAQDAATREVHEETGLDVAHPGGHPALVHVHVHDGGRGHTHLDTRWLVLADPDQPFAPAEGESEQVEWFDLDRLDEVTDPTVGVAVRSALARRDRDADPPGTDSGGALS